MLFYFATHKSSQKGQSHNSQIKYMYNKYSYSKYCTVKSLFTVKKA